VTDGQNRLAEIECILQQQLVHCRTGRISRPALRYPRFSVPLRLHIETAARQQNSLRAGEHLRHAVLRSVQRHNNRACSRGFKRSKIRRQRPRVVGRVAAGWLGNSNSHRHGIPSVMTSAEQRIASPPINRLQARRPLRWHRKPPGAPVPAALESPRAADRSARLSGEPSFLWSQSARQQSP